jgi:carbonic anhydrase/acetyltransferase-like protein (isoleucine patch superfamily)
VFVADGAQVIGNVEIGRSLGLVQHRPPRGREHHPHRATEQHPGPHDDPREKGTHPTRIGDDVTVGHHVVIHGCTIGNRVLVGIGAIVLNGVVIEDDAFIAAGRCSFRDARARRARW